MTAATTTRTVVIERAMRHPPEKVWRALTQGPLLEEWLMANDFEPVVGRRFTFRATPSPHWDGIVQGEVLVSEPPHRLSYGWNAAGGLNTVVTWTLEARDDGAWLRMEQSGFGPDETRNYQGASYGWQRNLDRLEQVINALT